MDARSPAIGLTVVTLTIAHYIDDPACRASVPSGPGVSPLLWRHVHGRSHRGHVYSAHRFRVPRRPAPLRTSTWLCGGLAPSIGLASASLVPVLAFTRHRVAPDAATPVWLLPVVAPMVSAASGALLLDHVHGSAAQSPRHRLLRAVWRHADGRHSPSSGSVWNRLAHYQHRDPATAPAMLIVLGPLGQSVTAAGLLADHAPESLGLTRHAMTASPSCSASPSWASPCCGSLIAGAIVADAARRGLPSRLAWWSFTFPIGTCVTGAACWRTTRGPPPSRRSPSLCIALLPLGWSLAAVGTLRMLVTPRLRARECVTASPAAG